MKNKAKVVKEAKPQINSKHKEFLELNKDNLVSPFQLTPEEIKELTPPYVTFGGYVLSSTSEDKGVSPEKGYKSFSQGNRNYFKLHLFGFTVVFDLCDDSYLTTESDLPDFNELVGLTLIPKSSYNSTHTTIINNSQLDSATLIGSCHISDTKVSNSIILESVIKESVLNNVVVRNGQIINSKLDSSGGMSSTYTGTNVTDSTIGAYSGYFYNSIVIDSKLSVIEGKPYMPLNCGDGTRIDLINAVVRNVELLKHQTVANLRVVGSSVNDLTISNTNTGGVIDANKRYDLVIESPFDYLTIPFDNCGFLQDFNLINLRYDINGREFVLFEGCINFNPLTITKDDYTDKDVLFTKVAKFVHREDAHVKTNDFRSSLIEHLTDLIFSRINVSNLLSEGRRGQYGKFVIGNHDSSSFGELIQYGLLRGEDGSVNLSSEVLYHLYKGVVIPFDPIPF